jgi:hypothetical protein
MLKVWYGPTISRHMLYTTPYNVRCCTSIFMYYAYHFPPVASYLAQLFSVAVNSTIKLIGAGAFRFHPTLEWIFVGDRGGTLLAWDVSTERPSMIGM